MVNKCQGCHQMAQRLLPLFYLCTSVHVHMYVWYVRVFMLVFKRSVHYSSSYCYLFLSLLLFLQLRQMLSGFLCNQFCLAIVASVVTYSHKYVATFTVELVFVLCIFCRSFFLFTPQTARCAAAIYLFY